MRPVVFTVSPSVMCLYSPSTTAPTESCSRFSARPKLPPGNSSISPYFTSARPWMRTMPSVTVTTVPMLRSSEALANFSMRALIRSLISEALIAMVPLPLMHDLRRESLEPCFERAVDDEVAGAHDSAADQRRIDRAVQAHFTLQPFLERRGQPRALCLVQLHSRGDVHVGDVLDLGAQLFVHRRDFGQHTEPAVLRERVQKIAAVLIRPARFGDQLDEIRRLHARTRQQLHHALVGDRGRRCSEHLRPVCKAVALARGLERGLRVRSGECDFLYHAMRALAPLDLERELLQQVGVRLGVDLATEELAGARDRDQRDLAAQLLACAIGFQRHLVACIGQQPLTLRDRGAARLLDHLVRAAVGLLDDLVRLHARFLDDVGRTRLRFRQALLGSLGRDQPVRDLALARLDGGDQRRPHKLHRDPAEDQEHQRLDDQRCVEIHGTISLALTVAGYAYWTNGLAVANHSAMPTPMMNDASIRPSSRKTFVCSVFISSGWRAEASMYLPDMMPTPMHAPSAPIPMIRPQASATKPTSVMCVLRG